VRLLLNILWVLFGGGLLLWLEYVIGGLLLCLTIIGILPFGKDIDIEPDAGTGALRLFFNVLWFLVAGVWIFLTHVALGLGLAVTIIGIPFAVQHFKLALLALRPFGLVTRG